MEDLRELTPDVEADEERAAIVGETEAPSGGAGSGRAARSEASQAAPADGRGGSVGARAGAPGVDREPVDAESGAGAPRAPVEGRGVALGGGGGYVGGSGAPASDGGGVGRGEGATLLRDLPPSLWERRARERDAEGVFRVSDGWRAELARNDKGALSKGVRNVMLILRNDERWSGRLRFNTLSMAVELDGSPVTDSDTLHARGVLERDYCLTIGDDLARQCLRLAAEFAPYDPRRDYLAALVWDGVERLSTVPARHFNSVHPLYPRYIEAFFAGAVRRVFEPGCKHDTMLILQGRQGDGKSTWGAELFGEWFTDSEIQLGSRDGALIISGVWGVELGEVDKHLAGRAEDAVVKAALTSRVDRFRRPYASVPEEVPRSMIFFGTTNKILIFRDHTGSRRFHLLEVQGRIPLELVRAERDQLFAEAVHRYRSGASDRYWLNPDEEAAREALAETYQRPDPWSDLAAAYCAKASNVTAVNSQRWGARYAVPVNALLGSCLGLEKREWRAQGAALGETMERLGAVRDVARFKGIEGGREVSTVAHAYLLPSSWAVEREGASRLASGELAPVETDPDAAALSSRVDALDLP